MTKSQALRTHVSPSDRPLILAVFDNDGTLCDSQGVDGSCYARAIEHVTGRSLATLDWNSYEEPTSSAIVRDMLVGDPTAQLAEAAIEREFLRLLEEEQPKLPGDFSPIPGAVDFIERLREENFCSIAIATGCFASTARFKLRCCGLDLDRLPHATSSDTPRRREIIPLAAARAGYAVTSVIYFADAPWDVRVSSLLEIPMIGMGRRIDQLRSLGVQHVFRDYTDADAIIQVLHAMKPRLGNSSE